MTDWTEALARMEFRVRETSNTFVDATDFVRLFNEGGRAFAAKTQAIRDIILVPIPATSAMDNQMIEDATNTFTRDDFLDTPELDYYIISKALYIDSIWLIDTSGNNRNRILDPIKQNEKERSNVINSSKTSTLPEGWRSRMPDRFEMWPRWTQAEFKLLIEYRRKWLDITPEGGDDDQENVILDDRWRSAPEEYVYWKLGPTLGLFDLAAIAKQAYDELVVDAINERWRESGVPPRKSISV